MKRNSAWDLNPFDKTHTIEYAPSDKSSCKGCCRKIPKGEIRAQLQISPYTYNFHVDCLHAENIFHFPVDCVKYPTHIQGWTAITPDDKKAVRKLFKSVNWACQEDAPCTCKAGDQA